MSIKIVIEIPEDEYRNWSSFEKGGISEVKFELNSDLRKACRDLWIEKYDIEIIED